MSANLATIVAYVARVPTANGAPKAPIGRVFGTRLLTGMYGT